MSETKPTKPGRGGSLKKVHIHARDPLPIRISANLIDRVDAVRPEEIPREPYVRYLLDMALKMVEDEG